MITASASASTTNHAKAPAGTHIARCYQLIDLGTREKNFSGDKKIVHELRVSWELPTELHVFKEERGEEPFTVNKTYTISLHEKANLRKDLENWRGRAFTEDELKKFDLAAVLGKACMLTVTHVEKDGSKYANVTAVTSVPKGFAPPPAINKPLEYSIEHHDQATFDSLPEFMREMIKGSNEWKARSAAPPAVDDTAPDDTASDDIPF